MDLTSSRQKTFSATPVFTSVACLFILLCPTPGYAEVIEISTISPATILKDHTDYFIDESAEQTLESLLDKSNHIVFEPYSSVGSVFGFSQSAFWFRFAIQNSTKESHSAFLEINYPLLDHIEVYIVPEQAKPRSYRLGDRFNYNTRPIDNRNFIVPLQLEPQDNAQVFLRIQTGSPVWVPINISKVNSFIKSDSSSIIFQGIYIGIVLVMAIYNIFVFFNLRAKAYLYYVACILSMAAWLNSVNGISFQYLWPNSIKWAESNLFIFWGTTMIFASLFANQFLELEKHAPRIHRAIQAIQIATGATLVSMLFLSYEALTIISNLISAIGTPIIFAAGVLRWRQGNSEAKYYTLAWGGLLIGVFLFNLTLLGIVPVNNLTLSTPQLGSAIEVILLSFALARKFKTLTDEKLQIQKEAADSLALKVEERTRDLNQALTDLKISETKLATQARLTSIGHLVTGVVHEVGNPLNFLRGSLELVRESIEEAAQKEVLPTKQLTKSVDMAERATERISVVLENLRTFLARGELELAPVSLEQAIQSTLSFVQRDMAEQKIEAVLDIQPCPAIVANEGVIRQVVLNIVINAMQAMEDGGSLNVQLKPMGSEIKLSIQDTGPGIPQDIRESIFDPFFTTKPPGESMGLGLSVTHEMMASYGGSIELGNPQSGAEFILTFPTPAAD